MDETDEEKASYGRAVYGIFYNNPTGDDFVAEEKFSSAVINTLHEIAVETERVMFKYTALAVGVLEKSKVETQNPSESKSEDDVGALKSRFDTRLRERERTRTRGKMDLMGALKHVHVFLTVEQTCRLQIAANRNMKHDILFWIHENARFCKHASYVLFRYGRRDEVNELARIIGCYRKKLDDLAEHMAKVDAERRFLTMGSIDVGGLVLHINDWDQYVDEETKAKHSGSSSEE